MSVSKVLSYLGGYFNSTEFELDLPKVADIAEYEEEELTAELEELQVVGDIKLDGNKVTLINIEPKISKKFNDLYAPVETMVWGKGMKLQLDK